MRVNKEEIEFSEAFIGSYLKSASDKRIQLLKNFFLEKGLQLNEEETKLFEKLLQNKSIQGYLRKDLKMYDLIFFVHEYSISKKYRKKLTESSPAVLRFKNKTSNKNLLSDITKSYKKFIINFNNSPLNISTGKIFLIRKRVEDLILFLREEKLIEFIDEDLMKSRYELLLRQANGDPTLVNFINYMMENNLISQVDNSNLITKYEKVFNRLTKFKGFGIKELIDDYHLRVKHILTNERTIRSDDFTHRTVFIRNVYNADADSKPFSMELIMVLVNILYEDLEYQNPITLVNIRQIVKKQ